MKLSEVTLDRVKAYCGVSGTDSDGLLELIMDGARAFMLNYTGLTEEQAEEYSDLTLAYLVLVNEMFTNRTYTVDMQSVNPFAAQIMGLYRMNLL